MARSKTGAMAMPGAPDLLPAPREPKAGADKGRDNTGAHPEAAARAAAAPPSTTANWWRRTVTALRPSQSAAARERSSEFAGIVIFVAAVGLTLALVSYDPADWRLMNQSGPKDVQNFIGPVGFRLADLLYRLLGVGSYGLVALLFTLSGRTIYGLDIAPRLHVVAGCIGALLSISTLLHLAAVGLTLRLHGRDLAGALGATVAELQRAFVSTAGTALAAGLVLTTSLSALTGRPLFRQAARWFGDEVLRLWRLGGERWRARAALRAEVAAADAAARAEAARAPEAAFDAERAPQPMPVAPQSVPSAPIGPAPMTIVAGPTTRPSGRLPRASAPLAPIPRSDAGLSAAGGVPATAPAAGDGFPAGHALAPAADLLPPPRNRLRALLETASQRTAESEVAEATQSSAAAAEDALPVSALVADADLPPPVPVAARPALALPAVGFALVTDADADDDGAALAADALLPEDDDAAALDDGPDEIYLDLSRTSIDLVAAPDRVDGLVDAPAGAAIDGVSTVPSLREALAVARANGPRIVETEAMRGNTPAKAPLGSQGALAIGDRKEWRLPPRTLVQPPPERSVLTPYDVLVDNARVLEQKLADFKITGEVTDIRPGPVVTTYEYKPAAGVKISRIAALRDDLTMSLAALRVRVVAPIPGRDVVGIEVPNKSRQIVYFREILESKVYADARSKLTIVLGKDIEGGAVVTDLAKAPHLLVAGATGTGKSVGINSFLASLLFRASPDEVKLLLIDPKVLELSVYEGIPHLLLPVIDDPHQAELALKWACREMDRRYHVLADQQVRNVSGYKDKLPELREKARRSRVAVRGGETVWIDQHEPGADRLPPAPEPEDLPYIVIVIDEFADLIMASGKEVEKAVARLAQKARAAGIHVILATQRPSTDVITGMIKANFPTRISFQVASSIDSKVVLNSVGAESLLGMGDMLFVPPGSSHIARCHGTWITDDEVVRLAEHWRAQGSPNYDLGILVDPEAEAPEVPDDDELDPLYAEAVRVAMDADQASVSFLQRKLNIGYGRAARIIDHMEAKGVVGPSRGPNKPREILSISDSF